MVYCTVDDNDRAVSPLSKRFRNAFTKVILELILHISAVEQFTINFLIHFSSLILVQLDVRF